MLMETHKLHCETEMSKFHCSIHRTQEQSRSIQILQCKNSKYELHNRPTHIKFTGKNDIIQHCSNMYPEQYP